MLHAQSKMLLGVQSEKSGNDSSSSSSSSNSDTSAASGVDLIPPNSPTLSEEVLTLFEESFERGLDEALEQQQDLPEQVGEAPGTPTTEKAESNVPCAINGVANHWSCVKCTQALSCRWRCIFPPCRRLSARDACWPSNAIGMHAGQLAFWCCVS